MVLTCRVAVLHQNGDIMWPGSPNIPRRARTKKKLAAWKEEEEEEQRQQAVRRDRKDRKQWLLLSFSLSFQELCSYIILPWYLMSQASSAWHSRLARQALLHRGGTLTHTPSQVISAAVRLWCKGARHIQKHLYCMLGKKKGKKAITRWFKRVRVSLLGMSLFDLLQICEADRMLLLDMGTDTACPLWVTGYYRCFTVHDGKQNCPFCCFFMATRKNVFIFQVYLVWLHTSQRHAGSTLQCDDCFVCLC